MTDELTIPDFLDRKLNGIKSEQPVSIRAKVQKLIWPKKRNWARIIKLERARSKRDGTSLKPGSFAQRSGQ